MAVRTWSAWFREVRYRALTHLQYGGMQGRQYAMVLYAVAAVGFRPSDKWAAAFYGGSGAWLARQGLEDMRGLGLAELAAGEAAAALPSRGVRGRGRAAAAAAAAAGTGSGGAGSSVGSRDADLDIQVRSP